LSPYKSSFQLSAIVFQLPPQSKVLRTDSSTVLIWAGRLRTTSVLAGCSWRRETASGFFPHLGELLDQNINRFSEYGRRRSEIAAIELAG